MRKLEGFCEIHVFMGGRGTCFSDKIAENIFFHIREVAFLDQISLFSAFDFLLSR